MPEITTENFSAMSRYEIEAIQRALKVCLGDSKPNKLEHFVLCLKKNFHKQINFSEILEKQSNNSQDRCRLKFSPTNLFSKFPRYSTQSQSISP